MANRQPFFPLQAAVSQLWYVTLRLLNVWKQDVLRLLALLGKDGMLIPHPQGAWQYGAAWWPPASPGPRCHNTSPIPNERRNHPSRSATPPSMRRVSDSSAAQQEPRVQEWYSTKNLFCWFWHVFFALTKVHIVHWSNYSDYFITLLERPWDLLRYSRVKRSSSLPHKKLTSVMGLALNAKQCTLPFKCF